MDDATHKIQALLDVITYQSYAGLIPEDREDKVLELIDQTFESDNLSYNNVLSYLYLCFREAICREEIKKRISEASCKETEQIYLEALKELKENA